MARNSVQFQKGLSEAEFEQQYGTEAACREALFRWRWPEGFECPICGEQRPCCMDQWERRPIGANFRAVHRIVLRRTDIAAVGEVAR